MRWGQDAEVLGQPWFGASGQLLAEGAGPMVEPGGQFVGDHWSVRRGPLGPGDFVAREVGQAELLQAVAQDGRDGPGLVQGCGGDLADEGVNVVAGELDGAELLMEDLAGVLTVIAPGLVSGEVGFDLLVRCRE